MPFSRDVREQAMVAAARHCCVCHRYGGIKVEVHHIIPEAQGGGNDLGNAIVLCFDCHADAGHYNATHPRGNKFSASELERSRDEWYRIVQEGSLSAPTEADLLYCRYIVCKSYEAVREICALDLSRLPVGNAVLLPTPILQFLQGVVAAHPHSYRSSHQWGEQFIDQQDYRQHRPGIESLNTGESGVRIL
jgi:HNH endonuclease